MSRTFRASPRQPTVAASIASSAVAFALSRGVTSDEIREATGISGLDLMPPEGRLPDSVLTDLWNIMAPRFPGEAISLQMARGAPLTSLAGLAHGASFAQNLREGLGLFIRNRELLSERLHLELVESGDEAALVMAHPNDDAEGGVLQ